MDAPGGSAGTLEPIQKAAAPLRRQVVDALRFSIVSGRLAPGARLVERELIDRMAVSRTVIREALRQLESEGLIDVVPNKGAVVRKLTLDEAKDLYSIRAVLEGLAARLFVENADEGARRQLEDALEATIQAYDQGDPNSILETKNRFYEVLFRGARSETLRGMIDSLHARIWRWRALGLAHPQRSPERSKESLSNLRAIVSAIARGDADGAESISRSEVMKAAAEAMRILAESGEDEPAHA
ncbi:GntR family transcriptional regulator [Faunimonas sp. B44]|uniref:GntR family transcriptional regulator n=1 Tax=Faunimonas sp. B44 TaxID=3461493 RepID=UPI004044783E